MTVNPSEIEVPPIVDEAHLFAPEETLVSACSKHFSQSHYPCFLNVMTKTVCRPQTSVPQNLYNVLTPVDCFMCCMLRLL